MARSRRMREEDLVEMPESEYDSKKIWLWSLVGIFLYACGMGAWLYLREPGKPIQDSKTEEARTTADGGVAEASDGGEAGTSQAVSRDPWDYVPNDAQGVGLLDVKKLVRAGMVDKVLDLAEGSEKKDGEKSIQEHLDALGLDPKKDVDSFLLVFDEKKAGAKNENGGAIVMGRFDTEAIFAYTKKENPGSRRSDVGGIPTMKIKAKTDGMSPKRDDDLMAILDNKVILAGTEDFVRGAIDVHRGKGDSMDKSSSDIVAKAQKYARRMFWLSSKVSAKKEEEPKSGQMSMQMGPDMSVVKHVILGADFKSGGFEMDARMECGSAEEAGKLQADMQSGVMMLTGMVGMFAQGDPDASKLAMEVAQAIQLGAEDNETTVSFAINEEMITRIQKTVESVAAKQGEGMMGGFPGEGGGSFQ